MTFDHYYYDDNYLRMCLCKYDMQIIDDIVLKIFTVLRGTICQFYIQLMNETESEKKNQSAVLMISTTAAHHSTFVPWQHHVSIIYTQREHSKAVHIEVLADFNFFFFSCMHLTGAACPWRSNARGTWCARGPRAALWAGRDAVFSATLCSCSTRSRSPLWARSSGIKQDKQGVLAGGSDSVFQVFEKRLESSLEADRLTGLVACWKRGFANWQQVDEGVIDCCVVKCDTRFTAQHPVREEIQERKISKFLRVEI